MVTIPMGEDHCPQCGKLVDTCTGVNSEDLPMPGDLSICLGCAGVNRYADDMALEAFPDILIDTLEPEFKEMLLDAQDMLKDLIKKQKEKGSQ